MQHKTQRATIQGVAYEFLCIKGRDGEEDIEVHIPGYAAALYPKYRYTRKIGYTPWTLIGKSTQESSKIKDELGNIWEGAYHGE